MSRTSLFDQLDAGYKHLGEDLAWLSDEPWPRLLTPHQDDPHHKSDEQETGLSPDVMSFSTVEVDDTVMLVDMPAIPEDFEEHTAPASDRKAVRLVWTVWMRRIVVVLLVVLLAAGVGVMVPSMVRAVRLQRAEQRLDTSMSTLRTADNTAQSVFNDLQRDELDDVKLYDRLDARIEANVSLLTFKRDSLDVDGLDMMTVQISEAAVSTRKLTARVSKSLQAKRLAVARDAGEKALREAEDKISLTESNETTETALKNLRKAISQASKLDDTSKASDWTKASERLTEAIRKVDEAVAIKQQADEEARQRAETEQQEQNQQAQSNGESYQPAAQQQYQSTPSQSPQSGGGTSSDGWSVPAPDDGTSLPGSDSSL